MLTRTVSRRLLTTFSAAGALGLLPACGSSDDGSDRDPGPTCSSAEIVENGKCVLNPFRFEPTERIDLNNIVYDGQFLPEMPDTLELLTDLPPAPRSGFRLVMTPQNVPSGYDSETEDPGIKDGGSCQAWPIPDLTHRWVYTAVVHTTEGLHHANLYGLALDPVAGPQPYPKCRTPADSLVFSQVFQFITGTPRKDLFVPSVLFANSTQVIGKSAERYALADGYAFEVEENHEVATSVHLQNPTPNELRVEAAWDFYTMPADEVVNPAAMFVYIHFGFLLSPRATETIHGNCNWGGGDVLGIMPHTHQWATNFRTAFGSAPMRAFDDAPEPRLDAFNEQVLAYDRAGTGLADSDIEMYSPPVKTDGMDTVQFQCSFDNTTDHEMTFGVGENEMCFLYGYMSPPETRRVGIMLGEATSCVTFQMYEEDEKFDLGGWIASQPPEADEDIQRLISRFGSGGGL